MMGSETSNIYFLKPLLCIHSAFAKKNRQKGLMSMAINDEPARRQREKTHPKESLTFIIFIIIFIISCVYNNSLYLLRTYVLCPVSKYFRCISLLCLLVL